MRTEKNKPVKKIYWIFYREDIEAFEWLAKINQQSRADTFADMLRVYPQANAEKAAKTGCEVHTLKEIMPPEHHVGA